MTEKGQHQESAVCQIPKVFELLTLHISKLERSSRQDIMKCEKECDQISVEKVLWLFSSGRGIVDSSQIIPPTELVITPMQATFGLWLSPIRSPNKVMIICMIIQFQVSEQTKLNLGFKWQRICHSQHTYFRIFSSLSVKPCHSVATLSEPSPCSNLIVNEPQEISRIFSDTSSTEHLKVGCPNR